MKVAVIAGLAIFVGWTLLALAQMWFDLLVWTVFVKISITAGMLLVLIIVAALAIREYVSDKDLKDKGFLD